MVNVRAYKHFNRMIVHFFDTGSKEDFQCPECAWGGNCQMEQGDFQSSSHSISPQAIQCPRCQQQLGIISQPITELTEISSFL